MKTIYNVFKLDGSFVGYAWATTPSEAIELVTGKKCQDYAHVALTQHGGNVQQDDTQAH